MKEPTAWMLQQNEPYERKELETNFLSAMAQKDHVRETGEMEDSINGWIQLLVWSF